MQRVSTNTLKRELARHIKITPQIKAILDKLKARRITLDTFCRQLALIAGATVLTDTVSGLRAKASGISLRRPMPPSTS